MPFQDFRAFLNALKKAGEFIEVDRPVSPMLEVAKAMRKSATVRRPSYSRTMEPNSHWSVVSTTRAPRR
jgi:UbiD family decarboxylase